MDDVTTDWECDECGSVWETDPPINGGPCDLCLSDAVADDAGPCCIAMVTSGGRDHVPGCEG